MRIKQLDHVNIVSDDVPATARFFAEVLGMETRLPPGADDPEMATWVFDTAGHPIFHLVSSAIEVRRYGRTGMEATGSIDHIALDCEGHDEIERRIKERGLEYWTRYVPQIPMRQLFTWDPNGVQLELNFRGD